MKRYILFTGYWYYPEGGARDEMRTFDNLDEAIAEGKKTITDPSEHWWNVLDCETAQHVADSNRGFMILKRISDETMRTV